MSVVVLVEAAQAAGEAAQTREGRSFAVVVIADAAGAAAVGGDVLGEAAGDVGADAGVAEHRRGSRTC